MPANNPNSANNSSTAFVPRSPLSDMLDSSRNSTSLIAPPKDADFSIGERRFLGKLALLGKGDQFMAAVSEALGFELPREPNQATQQDDLTALWLSPEEWLLVTPRSDHGNTCAMLSQVLAGIHALVIDVSDRWSVISVTGSQTINVLSKGTSLNLQASAFGPGHCAQTRLGNVAIVIHQHVDKSTYDLFVDSTIAEFLWCWLDNAATEFNPVIFFPDDKH
jgi:sarcosine oxidase subunit gamma